MAEADNRSASNILVLCLQHADEIDRREREAEYPASLLRQWKERQLSTYDGAVGGWDLTDDEAREVVAVSSNSDVALHGQTIVVGGSGGNAIGAAGGGGGAIGPGAIGGAGGNVGHIQLDGIAGTAPGAGGGGGGVLAPGAILPSSPPTATEGCGFIVGMDGQDGGESSISIGSEVLLTAAGGQAGLAGTGIRLTSDRLAVSAVMLVNYAENRGLASIVGGGWQNVSLLNIPTQCAFPLFVMFEAGGVEVGEFTVAAEVRDPSGMQRGRASWALTVTTAGDVVRVPLCCTLSAEVDSFGLWAMVICASGRELARIDVLVKRTGET